MPAEDSMGGMNDMSGRRISDNKNDTEKKTNVVLIGMPASGKSTVGIILAKVLGKDFIDCDLVIQKTTGKLLAGIISEEGAEGFIRTENRILSSIEAFDSVIATGGSAVYGEEAMANLCRGSIVVYLRVGFDAIKKRLRDIKQRGVVMKPGQSLEDIYKERTALYEKYADITIDETGKGIEEVVEEAAEEIRIY